MVRASPVGVLGRWLGRSACRPRTGRFRLGQIGVARGGVFVADLLSATRFTAISASEPPPQRKKKPTLEALIHHIEGLARREPGAMVTQPSEAVFDRKNQ